MHKDKDTIKTGARSKKGVPSRSSFLKIDFLQKHWKDAYGDSVTDVIGGEIFKCIFISSRRLLSAKCRLRRGRIPGLRSSYSLVQYVYEAVAKYISDSIE